MLNFISKAGIKSVLALFATLMAVLFICSICFSGFSSSNRFFGAISFSSIVVTLLAMVAFFIYVSAGLAILKKYTLSIKQLQKISLIATTTILVFIVLIYCQVPAVNDQGSLFTWPFIYEYWDHFDYMIPMGILGGILVKLFGSFGALLTFRVMNLALMVLAVWALGKLTKEFFDENATKVFYLIAPLCVQFLFFVSWAYGNIPGLCLMILGLYSLVLLFKRGSWKYLPLTLVLIFLALSFKLQAQIIIIAIIFSLGLSVSQVKSSQVKSSQVKSSQFLSYLG